jgi:hypothetical protein
MEAAGSFRRLCSGRGRDKAGTVCDCIRLLGPVPAKEARRSSEDQSAASPRGGDLRQDDNSKLLAVFARRGGAFRATSFPASATLRHGGWRIWSIRQWNSQFSHFSWRF